MPDTSPEAYSLEHFGIFGYLHGFGTLSFGIFGILGIYQDLEVQASRNIVKNKKYKKIRS